MEDNGNVGATTAFIKPTTSSSTEDLSEYTDADESISAPTEFLAEFLSAVMLKDYETALKYCKLILQYEPNNVTAKEFYPLIVEKLQILNATDGQDDEEDDDSDQDNSESTSSTSSNSSEIESDDFDAGDDRDVRKKGGDKSPSTDGDGDATTGSYSSLEEDDDAETVDQLVALAARYRVDNFRLESNGNSTIYDKTLADNVKLNNMEPGATALNQYGISSDSESPTEPVLSQLQSTSNSGMAAASNSSSRRLVPI